MKYTIMIDLEEYGSDDEVVETFNSFDAAVECASDLSKSSEM